jgi:hypothetical protein
MNAADLLTAAAGLVSGAGNDDDLLAGRHS